MYTNLLSSSYYDKRPRPIVYQYDSFRLYGTMFQEAYDRSRTWKLLSPEEWVTGAKGGPSMFLTEPGKPSKRLLEVGAFSAVATIGFDALATIDTVAIQVQLPRGLSDARLDELVRRTSERLCSEFWEGDADLDSFVPDRLEIDWFGLSVSMEVKRGDEPEMTIMMRSPKAEFARAA